MESISDSYSKLREKLVTDRDNVDQELIQHPPTMQDAAELSAMANDAERQARQNRDRTKAAAAARLRETIEKISDTAINARLALEEDVIEAEQALNDATLEMKFCSGLLESFKEKGYSIRKLADLIQSTYTAPNSNSPRPR